LEWLGRYQLGGIVPIAVWARTAETPTLPASAPVAEIYADNGDHVATEKLPIQDRFGVTARFAGRVHLDGRFATGPYRVAYRWTIGSDDFGAVDLFDVLAGGNISGAGIGMYFFRHPGSDYLLMQTDGGRIRRNRNPRI
jgi:hypothetical protein